MNPVGTIREVVTRVLAQIKPGDEAALEGVRFLGVFCEMADSGVPALVATSTNQLARLLVALQEHRDNGALVPVPSDIWLNDRVGAMAPEVARHWPFLFSVLLPSFERFASGNGDDQRDEMDLREWSTVQLVVNPVGPGHEVLKAIGERTMGAAQTQAAIDAAVDRIANDKNAARRKHPKPSAFYRPSGRGIDAAAAYGRKVLRGHRLDATDAAKHPEIEPSTLRRWRMAYRRQRDGIDPQDPAIYPMLEECFEEGPHEDIVARLRAAFERRKQHATDDGIGLAKLAERIGGESKRELLMIKQRLQEIVTKLRRQGRIAPRPQASKRESLSQAEVQTVLAEYRRRHERSRL